MFKTFPENSKVAENSDNGRRKRRGGEERSKGCRSADSVGEEHTSYNNEIRDLNLELTELQSLRVSDSAAPEIPRMSHTPPQGKPPKIPTEPASLRAPLSRSAFSKPKPVVPGEQKVTNEIPHLKSTATFPQRGIAKLQNRKHNTERRSEVRPNNPTNTVDRRRRGGR
ncbi:hypothetical protein C1H46_009604 [Malus baccata]|uniref:Uncharacterized protein n=1 Tax=Malus baccata TaxID=106549 RepID=A0A540N119_MALBA|nr:hypothetical protein C1H46_009604 [Malus baccata]